MKKLVIKKTALLTIVAVGLTSGMASSALANDGSSIRLNYQEGVKVYRATPPVRNHQAIAASRALNLQELQIKNQNRQAQARIKNDRNLNRDRLNLDRRIAFTNNEIFSERRNQSNRNNQNNGLIDRVFFGVNGISRNTQVSKGFK